MNEENKSTGIYAEQKCSECGDFIPMGGFPSLDGQEVKCAGCATDEEVQAFLELGNHRPSEEKPYQVVERLGHCMNVFGESIMQRQEEINQLIKRSEAMNEQTKKEYGVSF